MIRITIATFVLVLASISIFSWASNQDEAMITCQKKFSHDVCFQTLNR